MPSYNLEYTTTLTLLSRHDDVIKWKHLSALLVLCAGNHRSSVNYCKNIVGFQASLRYMSVWIIANTEIYLRYFFVRLVVMFMLVLVV